LLDFEQVQRLHSLIATFVFLLNQLARGVSPLDTQNFLSRKDDKKEIDKAY
jgi:hypothetical protein